MIQKIDNTCIVVLMNVNDALSILEGVLYNRLICLLADTIKT